MYFEILTTQEQELGYRKAAKKAGDRTWRTWVLRMLTLKTAELQKGPVPLQLVARDEDTDRQWGRDLTVRVSVRVSPELRAAIARAAKRAGWKSHSGFCRAVLQAAL